MLTCCALTSSRVEQAFCYHNNGFSHYSAIRQVNHYPWASLFLPIEKPRIVAKITVCVCVSVSLRSYINKTEDLTGAENKGETDTDFFKRVR